MKEEKNLFGTIYAAVLLAGLTLGVIGYVVSSVIIDSNMKSLGGISYAKDYKRIGEGDQGPNTGGMDTNSPVLDTPASDPEITTIEPN